MVTQRFEQHIIFEPAIANESHRNSDKMMGHLNHHLSSLIWFGLKREVFVRNLHVFNFALMSFFGQIATLDKEQICSASFNLLQQTNQYDILSSKIFWLVGFSVMIEEVRTTKDFTASFWVDKIIQCNH